MSSIEEVDSIQIGEKMKFSVCIELLFKELPFIDRIEKAKNHGFDAIEFWNWRSRDIKLIKKNCIKNKIKVAMINGLTPNSNSQMINPRDHEKCVNDIKESIKIAEELNCEFICVVTNHINEDWTCSPLPYNISEGKKVRNIVDILKKVAPFAESANVILALESLNVIVDHPGYYLNSVEKAFNIIEEVNHKNIRILFDIYHIQVSEGNIVSKLQKNINLISYIHIANVPGRHEPGTGELNYPYIFNKIVELGYK